MHSGRCCPTVPSRGTSSIPLLQDGDRRSTAHLSAPRCREYGGRGRVGAAGGSRHAPGDCTGHVFLGLSQGQGVQAPQPEGGLVAGGVWEVLDVPQRIPVGTMGVCCGFLTCAPCVAVEGVPMMGEGARYWLCALWAGLRGLTCGAAAVARQQPVLSRNRTGSVWL